MSFALSSNEPERSDINCSTKNKSNNKHSRRLSFRRKANITKFNFGSSKKDTELTTNFLIEDNVINYDSLNRVARPNQQNERRKEISLNLSILEIKNVPTKKRYYCEVYLDGELSGRTTTKVMGDMLFWGEEFNLCNLDEVSFITLMLWKCSGESRSKKKKGQRKEICKINISTKEIDQATNVEKWYSTSSNYNKTYSETTTPINHTNSSSDNIAYTVMSQSMTNASNGELSTQIPMIRIKARYQHLDVLPLSSYANLIKFFNNNAVTTLLEMEPYLKTKAKEDIAQNLIKIVSKQETAVTILCDLIINEISKSDDTNLILRGNTMATKAIEIYLKLVGEKYLRLTLSDFINNVLLEDDDCEVDPQKEPQDVHGGSSPAGVDFQYSLHQRQESLMMNVDMIWAKIMSSHIYFPKDLKAVFTELRERLRGCKPLQMTSRDESEPDLCDRIISSCIFLRFLCPAILTPSLFGLLPKYPDNPKVIRTFTLVAKCIQTLANFSNLCGTKETYMVFMNSFIENNFKTMRDFLREISSGTETEDEKNKSKFDFSLSSPSNPSENVYLESVNGSVSEDTIDVALCLATLHRQLRDCLQMITIQKSNGNLTDLNMILDDIDSQLMHKDEASVPLSQYGNHSKSNITLALPHHPTHTKRRSLDAGSRRNSNDASDHELDCGMHKTGPKPNSNDTPTKYSVLRTSNTGFRLYSDDSVDQKTTSESRVRKDSIDTAEHTPILESRESGSRRNSSDTVKHKALIKVTKSGIRRNSDDTRNRNHHQHSKATNPDLDYDTGTPRRASDQQLVGSKSIKPSSKHLFSNDQIKLESKVVQSASCVDKNNADKKFFVNSEDFSRSSDSLRKTVNTVITNPILSSFKRTVKRCKQAHQTLEFLSPSRYYTFKPHKDSQFKPKAPLSQQEELLDSGSTQTLSVSDASLSDTENIDNEIYKLANAVSMPAFHSEFDLKFGQPLQQTDKMLTTFHRTDDVSNTKSSFQAKMESEKPLQIIRDSKERLTSADDTNKIKDSLDNVSLTLSNRIKQLLLSDQRMIELELERVKLLKRICIGCDPHEIICNTRSILPGDRESQRTTMSVESYLNLAETVLTEAFNRHRNIDSCQGSVICRETEDFLVQIFQINKRLQSKLTSRSDGNVMEPDTSPRPVFNTDYNGHSSQVTSSSSIPVNLNYPHNATIEFIESL